jgi:hypothetical protein
MLALPRRLTTLLNQHYTLEITFCQEATGKAATAVALHESIGVALSGHDISCPYWDVKTRLKRTGGGVEGYCAKGPDFVGDGLVADLGH